MGRPKLSAPLLHPAAVEATAAKLLAKILENMRADNGHALPYVRVSQLCPPLSRPYVSGLIKDGVFRAKRYRGLLLIERESVEEFERKLTPWRPR